MTPETIGVTVTYKEPITFHLRMIGIDEENQLRQKMFGIPDNEKAEKAYQNNVDLLADLSLKEADGVEKHDSATGFVEDIRAYFTEKTVIKERLAEYAVRAYLMKLQPDVSFL